MSQHDMDVANGAGVVVRADINAALQALASSSSGSSAPSPSFPCQLWADTGTSRLKRRNLANSAWLDEGPLDAALRDAASQGEFISDAGAANAYVCNFVPALTVRSESTPLRFKVANANTTASTINDGIGTVSLVGAAHAALQGGELIANGIAWVQWNASVGGGSYVLLFCTGAPQQVADATKSKHAVTAGQIVQQTLVAFTTGGTAGALTLTPSPAISAYAAPLRYRVKFSQASTGTDTINVSAIGAKSIKQYDSSGAKVAAVFAANQLADVEYDGTDIVLLDQLPSTTQATEAVSGSMKIATLALVNALVNDLTAVTPLKLGSGFSTTKAVNGYIKLPEWLGSLIIQWGWANVTDDNNIDVTLPIAFPNTFYSAVATPQSTTATTGSGTFAASAFRKSLSIVQVGMNIGTGVGTTAAGVCWIAIGA